MGGAERVEGVDSEAHGRFWTFVMGEGESGLRGVLDPFTERTPAWSLGSFFHFRGGLRCGDGKKRVKLDSIHGETAWARRSRAGFRSAGLDGSAAAFIRAGSARPVGAAFLSRRLVTVLPPPVGGLPRALRGVACGRRGRGSRFRRCSEPIGGTAATPVVAIPDLVRQRAARCAGVGHLQPARERWNRQAGGLRYRSRPEGALRGSGYRCHEGASFGNCTHAADRGGG